MTPSTPAQPSIPPCVAHCTHCLPVCAELIGDRPKSPPDILPVALQQLFQGRLMRLAAPVLAWGARRHSCAPPSPKATSRAIFDDFHTGDRCRWSVHRRSLEATCSSDGLRHRTHPPNAWGQATLRDACESAPPHPPLRFGKMRVPHGERRLQPSLRTLSPAGRGSSHAPARGVTGLGLHVGRPRPAPRRPDHVE